MANRFHEANRRRWDAGSASWARRAYARGIWPRCHLDPSLAEHARLQAELHELMSATSRAVARPEALWGRSMRLVDGPPSARTVSNAWRVPARALAAIRRLRLYPRVG